MKAIMMTYYRPTLVDPYSPEAGIICQEIANSVPDCGYPDCKRKTVGCAVHEVTIKTETGYEAGCQFLPVCKKHKEWEYAKLRPVRPWGALNDL